ncbi:MAG: TolC family protein [Muribaculaceae bacterium]|nr:TolC family protein [Muribaculaceae bacterium]
MNKIIKITCMSALAIMMSSCHIYNKYQLPQDNAVAADYRQAVENQDSTGLAYMGWREIFTDPLLQGYIEQALANNTNLDNARLNVEIAKAQLQGAKLSYFPSLAFNPNGGTASYGGSHANWSYTLPLAANWEIDAFGKILNRKRGAKVSVEQTQAYEQAARSQIVTGVASTYYSLVLLHQQLDLSKRTAEIWKDQVSTMEQLKQAGSTTEAAVVQSRANYYNILASIPDLEQQITVVNNTLSVLLNTYPKDWEVSNNLDISLPKEAINGVPMSYLATRPDVAAAERGLAAAYYTVSSAHANFYPSISISAQGGFTNLLGSMISNPGKWFIQLAGQLAAPIFSRGQNIAQLKVAKAQQEQAMNNFENTVMSAASDVSDALVKIDKSAEKKRLVDLQVKELEKSVEYTNELFILNHQTSYLEVLTARSSLLQAQLASLSSWHARTAALISLYQAVGGGK